MFIQLFMSIKLHFSTAPKRNSCSDILPVQLLLPVMPV